MSAQISSHRSSCPVSCALDILGDKWTLLVLRDILLKRKRYFREFLTSPEKIASNILADRLKKLEVAGMILRRYDPNNGCKIAYTVTEKGTDLIPVILELLRWGAKHEVHNNGHDQLIERFERNPQEVITEIRSSLGMG
jgi:DNA-binding HxlR family transcriptional regulator